MRVVAGKVATLVGDKRSVDGHDSELLITGADLRRWRRSVGLSQAELARRLGYSSHTICQWETSAKRVPPAQYRRILDELLSAKQERDALRRIREQLDES